MKYDLIWYSYKRIIVFFFHCISQDKILISYNVMYINTILKNIKPRIYSIRPIEYFILTKYFVLICLFHYLKTLSIPICQIRLYLRVTFDDCNFFFFFCHSLALCSNDKQIVFLYVTLRIRNGWLILGENI